MSAKEKIRRAQGKKRSRQLLPWPGPVEFYVFQSGQKGHEVSSLNRWPCFMLCEDTLGKESMKLSDSVP